MMMDLFPSLPVMFGLDLAIITIAVIATAYVVRRRRDIARTRAVFGTVLVLGGIWGLTSVYVADLYSMTVMPEVVGRPAAMSFMTRLHTLYGWYLSTLAVATIAIGLGVLLAQILRQAKAQSEQLERLELNQDHFRQAAELAKVGYYIYDPATERMEYFTDTHAQNHGVGRDEYAEKVSTLSNDMPLIHPDDREAMLEGYQRVQMGQTVQLSYRAVSESGIRQVREIVKPIVDLDGKVIKELGTTTDVTEHLENEKLMFYAQRNEAIGQLTGGVAHDFNNLLAVIMGNLENVSEDLRTAKVDSKLWEKGNDAALTATTRGADLVKSLLSFARQADLEPESVDLNNLISETDGWLRRTLRSNIDTEISLHAGLWRVLVDRNEAQNALVNLILNAQNAMPDGGRLTIETSNMRISEEYVREKSEEVTPGRYVLIAISDTGVGIKPEQIDRIFDPFFSTRSPGEGSGLGLSMVQGFVRQSGGTIQVYSEDGVGTTFKLYFPATTSVAELPKATGPARTQVFPAGKRVLLAEDEHDVRELYSRNLRKAGAEVVTAHSGDEALNIFQSDRKFDLLVTDIVMPGKLQGPALAREIRSLEPEMAVVFLSGYANEAAVHGNGLRPEDIRLMKPVTKNEFLDAVQKALSTSS